MKLTKIGNAVANAVRDALTEAGLIKDNKVGGTIDLTAFQTSLTNGINTALEAMEAEMTTEITNGIADGLKGDALNTAIKNIMAAEGNPITLAITNATAGLAKATDVVTTAAFEAMKTDLTNKLGGQTLKNTRGKATTEAEAIEDTEGITWNVKKD